MFRQPEGNVVRSSRVRTQPWSFLRRLCTILNQRSWHIVKKENTKTKDVKGPIVAFSSAEDATPAAPATFDQSD